MSSVMRLSARDTRPNFGQHTNGGPPFSSESHDDCLPMYVHLDSPASSRVRRSSDMANLPGELPVLAMRCRSIYAYHCAESVEAESFRLRSITSQLGSSNAPSYRIWPHDSHWTRHQGAYRAWDEREHGQHGKVIRRGWSRGFRLLTG
jgi:hypothetical protein